MKAAFFFHPQPPTLSLFFLNLDSPRVAFTVINFEGKFFFFQIIMASNTFGKAFFTKNKHRFCPNGSRGNRHSRGPTGKKENSRTC